jgi:hypothetical protein
MHVELPLDQMTVADKLSVMESLWADLSRFPRDLPSPDWHRDVLRERKRLVEEGQLQFLDWRQAIDELRAEVRGDSPS